HDCGKSNFRVNVAAKSEQTSSSSGPLTSRVTSSPAARPNDNKDRMECNDARLPLLVHISILPEYP
ncbi:MAG: hypothetical protein PHY82_10195, partial [Lentisphaeria bacterium]|nr:hypothetical protein [Lentisphaeria bacterium]